MNMKKTQRKNDYLQKMLDAQVAYANELETQMTDKDESIKGYALHLEQVCEDLYNLKAENKRLREVEKHAIELAQENMNGYCRYAPARKILLLCGRCPECGNKIVGDCMVCKLANDALSKDKEQNAGNAVSK